MQEGISYLVQQVAAGLLRTTTRTIPCSTGYDNNDNDQCNYDDSNDNYEDDPQLNVLPPQLPLHSSGTSLEMPGIHIEALRSLLQVI